MQTPERCRAQADEAERLARLVSYARDRTRLTRQAADWRARAAELEAAPPAPAPPAPSPSLLDRLRHTLRRANN